MAGNLTVNFQKTWSIFRITKEVTGRIRSDIWNTTTESDALGRRKEILSEYRKNTDWLRPIVSVDKHLELV